MSEHQRKAQRRRRLRWILAALCALLSAGMFSWAVPSTIGIKYPGALLNEIPYNEATKAALDIRVQHTGNLFELTVLSLGALWALVIAKRDEARIAFGDRPELIMFVFASLSLLLSILWHEIYLDTLGYFLLLGARTCFNAPEKCLPDVFEYGPLKTVYTFQEVFLALGAGHAVITLVSAHRIKETKS